MDVNIKRDGLTLHGVLEGTDQLENQEVAILLHGFKGNMGYTPNHLNYQVAKRLNAKGIPTLRLDFNGCGKSEGDFADMDVFNEIEDAIQTLQFAKKVIKAEKVYVIGHSQGGVVASMLGGYYHDLIDKLVLLAPAATLKSDAINGKCQGVEYDSEHIPDQVVVDGWTVGGKYFRIAQLLPIYETAARYDGPVLLVHGLADKVVDYFASVKYDKIYQNSELHLIKGAGHRLFGDGGQRAETLQLISDFICKK